MISGKQKKQLAKRPEREMHRLLQSSDDAGRMLCGEHTHTHIVTGVRSCVTRGALRVVRPGTSRTNATVEGFRVRDRHTVHRR